MKLQYLNFTSIKRFAKTNKRRITTEFLGALDAHCGDLLARTLAVAANEVTFRGRHVAAAIENQTK